MERRWYPDGTSEFLSGQVQSAPKVRRWNKNSNQSLGIEKKPVVINHIQCSIKAQESKP